LSQRQPSNNVPMPRVPFNFKRQYQLLGDLLRPIDIESALLFCNHVLTACREEESDPIIRDLVNEFRLAHVPFLVHLAARQALLQSLGSSNRAIGTEDFKRLLNLLWEALEHDPAMEDPDWAQTNLAGYTIRFVGLQQRLIDIRLQTYGLAIALFTEEIPCGADESVDVPARVQEILGMSPVVFMRAGFAAVAIRTANSGQVELRGTISTDLVEKRSSEVGSGVADNWNRFLKLISGTQSVFRLKSREFTRSSSDLRYELYRFNMLRRFPLIDVGEKRFVIVDPDLVIARTTLGIYFDLLEADGTRFTDVFGYRFANLFGDLARKACGSNRVWSESSLPQQVRDKPPSKNADHALLGDTSTVLVECKALRPSTKLLRMGNLTDTDALVARVAAAIRQLTEHSKAIQTGKWAPLGLLARNCYGVVVTYERIPSSNGLPFRRKVHDLLNQDGCTHLPYLLLSISEFDTLLRLVERGNAPDAIMAKLTADNNGGFPGSFQSTLATDAISLVTRKRGEAFLATLPSKPESA